jgi:uncharacterized membrane protein YfcA
MPVTIFQSWPEYLVTCLILALAQAVYVLFGFGAGLIAVGSLALLFPEIQDVVVLLLFVNLPAELAVVLASRRVISWRGVFRILAGIVLGIPLGTYVLSREEPDFLLTVLGGFLLVAGVAFLLLPREKSWQLPHWSGPPTGLVSGILTGLFGTGGPPLIFYYHLGGAAKAAFRGNLMAIFLLKTFIRVPSYGMAGLITAPRLWSSLAVLPAIAFGAWLGHRIHVRLDEVTFRRLVSVMLLLLGLLILLRGCSEPTGHSERLLDEQRPLWVQQSRPGGLDDSCSRLEPMRIFLKS